MRMDDDKRFMQRALELARKGLGHTRPNPVVGAVIVKDGKVIGEGYHEYFGGPHAEVNAFAHCAESPEGATLYVTLEPCCHTGKTPPCTDLIISKGVDRVVLAMTDPNPLVAGKGIRKLRDAGLFVTTGVLEDEAQRLNEIFVKFITAKKPFVLYKAAMSLDGKIACPSGESQWISSEESRRECHTLRGIYKGIMVGAGTVSKDNPLLTARTEGFEDPVRIIVDGHLSAPLSSKVFQNDGEVIVLTTSEADSEKIEKLENLGIEVIVADGEEKGVVDLEVAMTGLVLKGIDGILLEGGAETAAAALKAGIVDKVRLYVAPMIIGGHRAPGVIGGDGAESLRSAIGLYDIRTERCDVDLVVEGYVKPPLTETEWKEKEEEIKEAVGLSPEMATVPLEEKDE